MTFDGANAFFWLTKWLGWLLVGAAFLAVVFSLNSQFQRPAQMIAVGLMGSGFGLVALGIFGQMIASIATNIQTMRELAEVQRKEVALRPAPVITQFVK